MEPGAISTGSCGVSIRTFPRTGFMSNLNNHLLFLIDSYVKKLEDEGYKFNHIVEAMEEFTDMAREYYYNRSRPRVWGRKMKLNFSGMSRVLSVLVLMRLLGTLIFMVIVSRAVTESPEQEEQPNLIKREAILRLKGTS